MAAELENCRKTYESEEMWHLRRAFLERHWDETAMTRNRLLSLAQMFINIEFMGCRYDDSLMSKVNEMSAGLVEERRDRRREVAEQIFTKGEKVSAEYGGKRGGTKKRKQDTEDEPPTKKTARSGGGGGGKNDGSVIVTTSNPQCAIKMKSLQALKAELMIMQQQRQPIDPMDVLNQATNRAKCQWRIQFNEPGRSCYLKVDDVLVVHHVYWGGQTRSRREACRRALEILQRPFFDVRPVSEKKGQSSSAPSDVEMELFTRRDVKGDWDSPQFARFDPLEQAYAGLRKRLVAIPESTRKMDPEKCLSESAKAEELQLDMKREHLGGWKEEIIVTVGKIELSRNQGQIPPKGKEKESANESYLAAIEHVLKPTFADGFRVDEENDVLALHPRPKSEKPSSSTASDRPPRAARQQSNNSDNNDVSRKELALKSVRLHLNATSEALNPISRIEQSCVKAKVQYEVEIDSSSTSAPSSQSFEAIVTIDGVRAGTGGDSTKKGAKSKACNEAIQQLLLPYIRIKQGLDGGGGGELVLESSRDPFDE